MVSNRVRTISASCSDTIRVVGMKFVLTPAAHILPVALARATAGALSLTLVVLPEPGLRTYRSMRLAFGGNRLGSLALTLESLARPFRDFVVQKQLAIGKQNTDDWTIVERNAEELSRLRESDQSYIVVAAHFTREAFLGLLSPDVTPGQPFVVGQAPPERVRSAKALRIRVQYTRFLGAISSAWGREVGFIFTDTDEFAAHAIYKKLRGRRNVIFIHVDAPWPSAATGTIEHTFAADPSRSFATGVVELQNRTRLVITFVHQW
jgi:hypothetical protein